MRVVFDFGVLYSFFVSLFLSLFLCFFSFFLSFLCFCVCLFVSFFLSIVCCALQLSRLDEDEVEHGWADALEEEWDQKTNCSDMLNEEILQLRIRVKKCEDMIEADTLEIEEIEGDLEECYVEVCEEYQLNRAREFDRIETAMYVLPACNIYCNAALDRT